MEYLELNYVSYEHLFVRYCNGGIDTGLETLKTVPCYAQNVDWFILLPAIMNEEERIKYLGADYQSITKDTLNAMRKGKVRRQYIDALFWKKDAVQIVKSHFQKKVPQAIIGINRTDLVNALWAVILQDVIIPEKRRKAFEAEIFAFANEAEDNVVFADSGQESCDAFCQFLADTFVFAMNRDNLLNSELQLSPTVRQVIHDLNQEKTTFLKPLLTSMADALVLGKEDEGNNSVLKTENDSDFSNDDIRYVATRMLPYRMKLDPESRGKYDAIRLFAFMLDRQRVMEVGGMYLTDTIGTKYGFPPGSIRELMIDPGIDNANYEYELGGKKVTTDVKRLPDGTVEIYIRKKAKD